MDARNFCCNLQEKKKRYPNVNRTKNATLSKKTKYQKTNTKQEKKTKKTPKNHTKEKNV